MKKLWGKRSSHFYWNINLVAEKLISKKKWNRRKRKKAERNEIKEEATIWERVFSEANESKRNNRTTTNQWNKSSVYFAQEKRIFHSILTLSSLFTLLQPWCFFFFWWSFYSASTLILFILHFFCVGFSFHQK